MLMYLNETKRLVEFGALEFSWLILFAPPEALAECRNAFKKILATWTKNSFYRTLDIVAISASPVSGVLRT